MLSYAYAGIDPDAARFLKCNKDFSLSLYAASDIGIHYYGWDFNKLCDFWKDYGITDVNALKEVQRLIISSPANYLKYYVGYLQIEKLKDSQKETLGGDYSDMEFHKAFLKIGPAPFHIIEKYINNPGIIIPGYCHSSKSCLYISLLLTPLSFATRFIASFLSIPCDS